MSHEMYENDSAMYAGQSAWHGLGTVVEDAPSPYEALKLSGLDWEVEKSGALGALRHDGGISYTSEAVATIRKDTNEILGIVGPHYEVVQNKELFDVAYELGKNIQEKLQAMREALSMYRETGKMFRQTVQELSMYSWDRHQISNFWMNVYQTIEGPVNPNPSNEEEENDYKKAVVTLESWSETFDKERHLAGTGPWNAANAVTNWIQHRVPTRGRKRTATSKVQRNLLGDGQKQSLKVMQMAMKAV